MWCHYEKSKETQSKYGWKWVAARRQQPRKHHDGGASNWNTSISYDELGEDMKNKRKENKFWSREKKNEIWYSFVNKYQGYCLLLKKMSREFILHFFHINISLASLDLFCTKREKLIVETLEWQPSPL